MLTPGLGIRVTTKLDQEPCTNAPEYQSCTWQAFGSGGTGNYSYQWSGILSGLGSSISGVVSSSTLYVTVTDGSGQASNQMSVYVDEWAEECIE